jgi:hypothetical protein
MPGAPPTSPAPFSAAVQLVNEIAQRWGFLPERTGTCVWFELAPED